MSICHPFHDPSHPYQTSVSNLFPSTPSVFFISNFSIYFLIGHARQKPMSHFSLWLPYLPCYAGPGEEMTNAAMSHIFYSALGSDEATRKETSISLPPFGRCAVKRWMITVMGFLRADGEASTGPSDIQLAPQRGPKQVFYLLWPFHMSTPFCPVHK